MSYITYGPSPTSTFRTIATPADSLLVSPLDEGETPSTSRRRHARTASRGAPRIAGIVAVIAVAAAAALALRLAGGFF